MTRFRSILAALALLVLIATVPLLGLLAYNIHSEYQTERDLAMQQLDFMRRTTAHSLTSYLRDLRALLSHLALRPELLGTDQAAMTRVLQDAKSPRPDLSNLAFLNQEGRIIATIFFAPTDPTTTLRHLPAYVEGLDADGFHLSRPFVGTFTKRWTCAASHPVRNKDGYRIGTIIAPLNLLELSERIFAANTGPDTILTVLAKDGTVLLRSYDAAKTIGTATEHGRSIYQRLRSGESTGYLTGRDLRERIYTIGELPETQFLVAATVLRDTIFVSADANLRRSLLLLALLILVAGFACLIFSRSISRPVHALSQAARGQAEGHSAALALVSGPAEIADTARAFNTMAARRHAAENALRQQTDFLETLHTSTLDLLSQHSRKSLLQGIVNRAAQALSAPLVELMLREGDTLVVVAYTENQPFLEGDRLPKSPDSISWQAVETRQPTLLGDYSSHSSRRDIYSKVTIRAAGDFPIMSGQTCIGVLGLGRLEAGRPFTPEEVKKAQHFCSLIAVVLLHSSNAEALRENELRYRTVIDQTGQMIYDLDLASGRNLWFGSEAIPTITGYTVEEFQQIDFSEWGRMIHPDDQAESLRLFDAALASAEPYHTEYRFRHKDGTYRHVEDHGVFLVDAKGKPYRMLGRMSDTSARRKAEDDRAQIEKKLLETQKLESLGILAGGVAHDFNNLLTGILGNASLARLEQPAGGNTASLLLQIETAAHRAADLCKQMLAYSGKGRFVVQRLDLGAIVRDTVQLLHASISKKARLHLKLAERLPPVQVDATQIQQLVMNLVINASEALGENSGDITLHTGVVQADSAYLANSSVTGNLPPGRYVYLEVADTGVGMDRETSARIFDPFFSTKFTGRGLGLAAVQGIVRGHRGVIRVYSEPGKGTTFKILIPATEGEAEARAINSSTASAWKGTGRILIIDDEPTVREAAAGILRSRGFATATASDGCEGLDVFQAAGEPFTAVLLDLTMPNMDGEETFRQLRQLRPGVKVVLMSGFNKVDAINRFTGKGLAGFVQKPFDIESLIRELRRVLEE